MKPPAAHAQSASSIMAFKSCPMLYYLGYIQKLKPVETSDALRRGTNWHSCLEILTMKPGDTCPNWIIGKDTQHGRHDESCSLCDGSGQLPNDLRVSLIGHLNKAYENRPLSVEPEDWEIERIILLNSAIGWQWYWQDDAVETLAREIEFHRKPDNLSRDRAHRIGRIDRIVRWNGRIMLGEYKSTSKPIDSGSVYWRQLRYNSQLSLYLVEARRLQQIEKSEGRPWPFPDAPLISGVLFDVWHKPQIRPKKLTQAETKKFVENGEYCGQHFVTEDREGLWINGVMAEEIPGKKEGTFAIRETPDMFGARLLADIQAHPEKHYARREVARTDDELERADVEFRNIARLTQLMDMRDLWFRNEQHCNATYRCQFFSICNQGLLPDVRDGKIPEGFRRKGT